jgi:hypothetical protein
LAPGKPLTPEQQQVKEQQLAAEQRQLEDEFGQPHSSRVTSRSHAIPSPSAPPSPTTQQSSPSGQIATPSHAPQLRIPDFLLGLLWLTLGSPLAIFWIKGHTSSALINLAILSVGIACAWRITAGVNLVIYGPFDAHMS